MCYDKLQKTLTYLHLLPVYCHAKRPFNFHEIQDVSNRLCCSRFFSEFDRLTWEVFVFAQAARAVWVFAISFSDRSGKYRCKLKILNKEVSRLYAELLPRFQTTCGRHMSSSSEIFAQNLTRMPSAHCLHVVRTLSTRHLHEISTPKIIFQLNSRAAALLKTLPEYSSIIFHRRTFKAKM